MVVDKLNTSASESSRTICLGSYIWVVQKVMIEVEEYKGSIISFCNDNVSWPLRWVNGSSEMSTVLLSLFVGFLT